MQKNTDLHLHSCFSMATSPGMLPENILAGCRVKGIEVVGSGDALHSEWRRMWEPHLDNEFGIIVVPQVEVEDSSRVHHVILAETFDQFVELQEMFLPACGYLTTTGRPHLQLSGEQIASAVHDVDGMIGPAHVFTPWTSLFAAHASSFECYGEELFEFCELGLSADSVYGASIAEFAEIPFLTNSDAHSPIPAKLGREFTRMEIKTPTPKAVLAAISAGTIAMNVGFFPEMGKYNRTACTRCYEQFSLAEAERLRWECPHDKGKIKLGVRERAEKFSTLSEQTSRPPYLKMIPLGEVIACVLGTASPNTNKCKTLYNKFIEAFDNEIAVLLEVPSRDLRSVSPDVANAVMMMRQGRITLFPGGGGKYGSFSL
jgi:uncharacterized protein (TIGR00375 family)